MDNDETALLPRQTPTASRPPNNDRTFLLPKRTPGAGMPARADGWSAGAPVDVAAAGRARSLTTLAWLLPTLTMAALGTVRATWPNLDAYELATWGAARSSWDQLWQSRGDADVTTLPYHLFIRLWSTLAGTSDLALRMPSILAMSAAAALTAVLASRLAGPKVGLLASLLLVAVPTTSRYAQTAGPEALAVLTALVATLVLVTLLDKGGTGRIIGYTAALMAMTLSHGATLTVVVAHFLVVLAMRRRLTLPWLLAAFLGTTPITALLLMDPPAWLRQLALGSADLPPADALATTLFGLALLGGMTTGLALFSLSLKKPAVVFTTWALVPLAGLYLAVRLTPYEPVPLLFFAMPAWVSLAALTLGRVVVVRGLAVCLVIAALGMNAQISVRGTEGHGQAPAALADRLGAEFKSGDVVIYGPTAKDAQVGRDVVARYVPENRRPGDVLATRPPRTAGFLYAEECPDVAACLGDAPRVWLVRPQSAGDPLAGLPAAKADLLRTAFVPHWMIQV